jgi:hypothetical protein
MFGYYGQNWQTQTMWARMRGSRLPSVIVNHYQQIPSAQSTVVVTPQTTAGWGEYGMTPGTTTALLLAPVTGGLSLPFAALSALKGQKGRCKRLKAKYQKLKAKGADAKKLAKVKEKYTKACQLYALQKEKTKVRAQSKGRMKAIRKGQPLPTVTRTATAGKDSRVRSQRGRPERGGRPGKRGGREAIEPTAMIATTPEGEIDDADLEAAIDEAPETVAGGGMLASIPQWVWIAGAGALVLGLLALGAKGKGGKGFKFGGGRKSESVPAV